MQKNYKKWLAASTLAILLGATPDAMAQAVIFPQQEQPGIANVQQKSNTFTLSNELLSASFEKEGGKIVFKGCKAMDLLPSDEIFKITVGNGTEVLASQMQLDKVEMVDLAANPKAAKGALKLPGKAIVAHYTYKDLSLTWRAVLRNGSHYLRTEMEIKANKDTKMHSIIPMLYTVNNEGNSSVPVVVGNTRGAMIASNEIFAGLETPMGINTVESGTNYAAFTAKSWNPQSFNAIEQLPEDLKSGSLLQPNAPLKAENVKMATGFIKCYEAGDMNLTFVYRNGGNRLNIVGVELLDFQGKRVSHDFHLGCAGTNSQSNTYKVNVPAKGFYRICYYVEDRSENITSSGEIQFNKKVAQPQVVFDGKAMTPAQQRKAAKAQAKAEKKLRAMSGTTLGEGDEIMDSWKANEWNVANSIPKRIEEMGFNASQTRKIDQEVNLTVAGDLTVEFNYKSGSHQLNLIGVALLNGEGQEVAYDYHIGFTGNNKKDNIYRLKVPNAGHFTLRYYAETKTESITSDGNIRVALDVDNVIHLPAPKVTPIQGKWSRNVVLQAGKTWNVSAVVGIMAPEQARRSVLSYIERERAVPWRAYPIYNSWYELNIDRNNDRNYTTNMNVGQCAEVVAQWKRNLYDKYNTGIQAFVWDDGWDQYGPWTFNKNFPNGFKEPDQLARAMESGIGAWLGPVGGYGQSGTYRRNYWKDNGGMQLSNPAYYDVFYNACSKMIKDYDFRYFKFDGISAQWSSVGPDAGTVGEENAEGIINAELEMRKVKDDIFFNTTVGTWASPFWFHVTDAVWRQENDWSAIGNQGSDRERWITYRDRLVYQNFVKNSPLCPINNLMTHGFILTKFGDVSRDMNYDGIVRELRCAFACGSAMVELYADFKLMNEIKNNEGVAGALWKDMADCIHWQKKNEEVLPDVHWVGGNPWNGSKCEVYGWAAWNGKNATLALRNGATYQQTFKTTLRKALEIPSYIKCSVTFNKGFEQPDLQGLPTGQPIDIDKELTIILPASSVFVFDNTEARPQMSYEIRPEAQTSNLADGYYIIRSTHENGKGYIGSTQQQMAQNNVQLEGHLKDNQLNFLWKVDNDGEGNYRITNYADHTPLNQAIAEDGNSLRLDDLCPFS